MRSLLLLLLSLALTPLTLTPAVTLAQSLPRSTPEAQGVSSEQIIEYIKASDQQVDSMHSFMLVRNGHVVAEAWWAPHTPQEPHILWSLSKSFTSTAVGLAIEDGKMSLDDRVLDYFPKKAPENPSVNLQAMTVRDLLTMSTGHESEPNWRVSQDWLGTFMNHEVPYEPGTRFKYNTPATFMLSAIVQKVTGETVLDYLTPRLFEPLGIETPRWDKSPEGISIGGYGLFLPTEAIAKFGQLYLQNGKWEGRQIVPAKWVEQATSKQISNGEGPASDWQQGYGFQFWRSRHGAYRGDGKDGQFCIVLPEQNAVIAITANTRNMQQELNLVWEHLLPALSDQSLEEDPDAQRELSELTSQLEATR